MITASPVAQVVSLGNAIMRLRSLLKVFDMRVLSAPRGSQKHSSSASRAITPPTLSADHQHEDHSAPARRDGGRVPKHFHVEPRCISFAGFNLLHCTALRLIYQALIARISEMVNFPARPKKFVALSILASQRVCSLQSRSTGSTENIAGFLTFYCSTCLWITVRI